VKEDRVCRACNVNPCSPGSVSCEDCFGKPEARNPELVALGLFDAPRQHRTFEDLTIRELRSAVEFLSAQDQSAVLQTLVGYGFGPPGSREHARLETIAGKLAALLVYESIRAAIRKPEHDSGMHEYGMRAMATH